MLLNLNSKAPPVFLSAPYINRHTNKGGDLVVSSGTDLRKRLLDMDPASQWSGDNADDGVDETLTAGFWLPGFQTSYDVDFIAVLGHNLKAFDIKLSNDNGGTYPTTYNYTDQTANYVIKNVGTAVAADKLQLVAHTTQDEDDYKKIGCLIAASVLLQSPLPMNLFEPQPFRVRPREARMYDNSTRRSFIRRSAAKTYFRDFRVAISGLTESQADDLEAILMDPDPFLFYPEPGDKPRNIYLGQADPQTVHRRYVHLSRSGGEMITFDFEEAGGA